MSRFMMSPRNMCTQAKLLDVLPNKGSLSPISIGTGRQATKTSQLRGHSSVTTSLYDGFGASGYHRRTQTRLESPWGAENRGRKTTVPFATKVTSSSRAEHKQCNL